VRSSALLTDEAAIKLILLALGNMTPRQGARRPSTGISRWQQSAGLFEHPFTNSASLE